MTALPTSTRARLLVAAATVVALVAAVALWLATRGPQDPGVDSAVPARSGWTTIEHDGVRVDVPASWEHADMDDCEFGFEHWGPAGGPACGQGGGVSFYGSATFDPAHGPGVRRAGRADGPDSPTWAGYAYAGDYAVYASDDTRSVVRRVLRSAR